MQQALLQRNANHFNQAQETPMAQPPISDIIPPFNPSPDIAQCILSGNLTDFTTQSEIIQEILQNLEKLPNTNDINLQLSDEEFVAGMQSIGEGKSSSQSGRHYSLYKAFLTFPFTTNIMTLLIN